MDAEFSTRGRLNASHGLLIPTISGCRVQPGMINTSHSLPMISHILSTRRAVSAHGPARHLETPESQPKLLHILKTLE